MTGVSGLRFEFSVGVCSVGVEVQDLVFGFWVLGFWFGGLGFGDWGSVFGVLGSGFWVLGLRV